jgi:hypothetical protein
VGAHRPEADESNLHTPLLFGRIFSRSLRRDQSVGKSVEDKTRYRDMPWLNHALPTLFDRRAGWSGVLRGHEFKD